MEVYFILKQCFVFLAAFQDAYSDTDTSINMPIHHESRRAPVMPAERQGFDLVNL